MSRKLIVDGREQGDWFDAILDWAKPNEKSKPSKRLPKEKVVKAARSIKTREQLMPTTGPSEPHTVTTPVEVETPVAVNSNPPTMLACGHWNWYPEDKQTEAREQGFCCDAGRTKVPPDWRVKGLTHAVPMSLRRSAERERGTGFPGLCCHPETGLFIGGLANDCRRYSTDRCVVHSVKTEVSREHSE
jgi:hypothetical protein